MNQNLARKNPCFPRSEQTDASTILDGTKVLILTGFVGDDYLNNFNTSTLTIQ